MEKLNKVLENLSRQGRRITTARKAMIDFFMQNHAPCSALQAQKWLSKNNIKANKTTVYRELDFMKREGLVEEFSFGDGVKRYEAVLSHHHHIICLKCDKVECVKLGKELLSQEKKIEKNTKFKILSHSLEFFGFCPKCRADK